MGFRAKRHGHVDANHKEIADDCRDLGFSVGETSAAAGFVDMVVAKAGRTVLVEVKVDETSPVDISQLEFLIAWKGEGIIATSTEDIMQVFTGRKPPLTGEQKNALLELCETAKKARTLRERKRGIKIKSKLTIPMRQVMKAIEE